jgi:cytochrome b subunit of formate dehydrogenase
VFTGFALKFPETWIFSWLARLEGGYAWRSLIHRGAALVMVAAALSHLVYLFGARGRRFLLDMLPTLGDARHAAQNLSYWLGLTRTPPKFERFGYIEKAEYWALIWGTVVMTVTGGLLWFENQSLQVLDKWVLDLATLVHYYEAWLAFLAIVVWHLYQNVANPDVYPMNWSWLTGRIGEEQLRHEHQAEWEKLVAAEAAQEETEPDETDPSPGGAPSPSPG